MCDPMTLAIGSIAIGVGGEVLQAKAQNKASKQNSAEARIAETLQVNDINLRETQEKAAASQDLVAGERQTTTALSSARVSAGEAGVAGASVDALLNDIGNEGSTFAQTVRLNTKNTISQLERNKLGVAAQAESRINSVPKANVFASALRIGGIVTAGASQILDRRAPRAK